ncbi:CUB and sushi domain-containing protein 3-like isoform X2 [Haliotis rubra]|uniref:CUB and sushi domain-containing protein 3-like isoform X2 n=1 Tax=Haliotis rubra TaxID=36100 RepID=UPI001EE5CF47|nr:CUB and sushi domain-containing protein 3-like isoform X2 [Haliotis rubra]
MVFWIRFYFTLVVSVFSFNNVSGDIDRTLTATKEELYLTSPGYPLGYPNNLQSKWEIVGPEFSKIKVTVLSTDIDRQDGCEGDYVEVLDGSTTNWGVASLGSFCFNTPSFTSSGPIITIRFTTDGSGTSKGFRLKYHYEETDTDTSLIHGILIMVGVVVFFIVLYTTATRCSKKNSERRNPLENLHQNQHTEQGSPNSYGTELSAPPPTYNEVVNSGNINNNNYNKDNLDDTSPPPYSSLRISDTTVDMQLNERDNTQSSSPTGSVC